jgi:3-oxoadipate CoA-transferase alpha subunit
MLNKLVASCEAAVADVHDGASILVGGFGAAGMPEALLAALVRGKAKDLTLIANNAGRGEGPFAQLIKRGRVRKVICSFPEAKEAHHFRARYLAGQIELELVPQGTLAERIRAGGSGIEGFYTPTGVGTEVAVGKPTMEFNGITCLLERALRADFAFIRGRSGDRWGNVDYDKAQRNFNPMMAMAGKVTIAEVTNVVDLGDLHPEHVVTPGIFVQRVVQTEAIDV